MSARLALLSAALMAVCSSTSAQTFNNLVFFGDSASDSGRWLYLPRIIGDNTTFATVGGFTTNPGAVWSVDLGRRFGVVVTPSDAPGGGNNYAAGGARVVASPSTNNIWGTKKQVNTYLSNNGGVADPNTLYSLFVGVNDLKPGVTDIATGVAYLTTTSYNIGEITSLGQSAAQQISLLRDAGARYFLIPNAMYWQNTASAAAAGSTFNSNTYAARTLYPQVVWNTVADNKINFIPADIMSMLNHVLVNPARFGIVNTSIINAACGTTLNSIDCGPANYVTPNADQTYFFADGQGSSLGGGHLTTATQKIEADYYYSLIAAPGQISLLPEAALKTRASFVNGVSSQIALSFAQDGSYHTWLSGDLASLKLHNFAGFSSDAGNPAFAAGGWDFKFAEHWLAGAAFSYGATSQRFSSGGSYKTSDVSGSLYLSFRSSPVWLNAVASFGTLQFDVNRQVPIGVSIQPNYGTATGSNVSFLGEGGYDFDAVLEDGKISARHGPLIGSLAQRAFISGFTENNPTGAPTSLTFASQRRDSFVGKVGYQGSIKWNNLEPFAKAEWNHELANQSRVVTASLTSVTAPSYYMPAVRLGRDWGTATLGVRYYFKPQAVAFVSTFAQVGQSKVTNYGAHVGVNFTLD